MLNRTLLAAGFLITAGAASAQQAEVMVTSDYLKMGWESVSTQVPYGDLNLATDKGVDTLRQRVKAEADKMCGSADKSLKSKENRDACYNSVMASAEPQIVQLSANSKR